MQEAVKREDDAAIKESYKESVVELRKPVQAHGEMITKMVFRPPTGGDILQIGDRWPVHIDWGTGLVTPIPSVMGTVMSILAAVPPSTIKMMDANDFTDAAYVLMRFFVPNAQRMQF